jgi:hypothetical protein
MGAQAVKPSASAEKAWRDLLDARYARQCIEYAHDERLGLLTAYDPVALHRYSERAIGIMRDTGTHAAHHPAPPALHYPDAVLCRS